VDCFRGHGGDVFGLPPAFQHHPDLVARLEERRVAAGLAEEGIEVRMLPPQLVDEGKKGVREVGIELRPAPLADFLERAVDRPRRRVGPSMGEGIKNVGKRDDARVNRDSLAGQLRGIPGAVPPFVVVPGDFFGDA